MGYYHEKSYDWSFEVIGRYAMFTRPDSGSAPISYPVPTKSAILGMTSCLVFGKEAFFVPERVEICAPIIYHKLVQNYNGPLRKNDRGPFQIMMTVLENVDYKIYGTTREYAQSRRNSNPQHELQEIFARRLKKGLFYRTPCLGLKEFVPTYFGPLRSDTVVDTSINLVIPSMLVEIFDHSGRLAPRFVQNAAIDRGVLRYA